jgi:hypothetical protein
MRSVLPRLLALSIALVACADSPAADAPAYLDHPEAAELAALDDGKADGSGAGLALIMTDAMFLDPSGHVDAARVQAELEDNVYGTRSWLADEMIGEETFAEALTRVSREHGLSPLLVLARLQIEQSLVSRVERPADRTVNRALGCGCHDGQACFDRFLGLENQLRCAAETFRKLYDMSVDGSGWWRKSKAHKTLDGVRVTPVSHATAALYAYTPWALPGRGGNWLIRRLTLKMAAHMGIFEGFTGTPCADGGACQFDHRDVVGGLCLHDAFWEAGPSTCSVSCEGFCDDKGGHATTFCAEVGRLTSDKPFGLCLSRAHTLNRQCARDAGTVAVKAARFLGESGATEAEATVCAPAWLAPAIDVEAEGPPAE